MALCLLAGASMAETPQTLRVGIYEDAPKVFTGPDGTPSGILIDLLRHIAEREHWRLVFVACQWRSCLDQLTAGSIDLMPDVADSDERGRRFDLHRTPALHSWGQVYRRRGTPIDAITDLNGKRIGMLAGNVHEAGLRSMLDSFGIAAEITGTASSDEAFQAVAAGRADAAVASVQFGTYKSADYGLVETPIAFMPVHLFYATGKGRHADVLARIDSNLDALQGEPDSAYYRIVQRWGGRAPPTLVPEGVRNTLVVLAGLGLVLLAGVAVLQRRVKARTRELLQVNRQLEATLHAIPDLLFELDLEGRYHALYAMRPDQLAAPADSVIGKTLQDLLPEAAARTGLAALREADAKGVSTGRQIQLTTASGPMWFELSVAKKPANATDPPRFVVLSRDITARKNAEERVLRLSRLYETLSRCNQAIAQCTDESGMLQRICRDAVGSGGFALVWIGLLDGSGHLVPAASHGEGQAYLEGIRISIDGDNPTGRGPTGTSMRENRAVWCQVIASDPSTVLWRERAREFGWASSAALPLHRAGEVIGALTLYDRQTHAFDADAQVLLLQMAADIDSSIERFRQQAERERLAAAVFESEEKYRELAESTNDVIWTLDTETLRFLYVSPSVQRLRGYTPEEVMAAPLDAALTAQGATHVRELLAADRAEFLAGRRTSADASLTEIEQPCKDGSTVWTEVVTNLVMNRRSGHLEVHGVTRDISERKRAEAQIHELARFDPLTHLPNRAHLKERFDLALSMAQRYGHPLALLFVDLDHFKDINDTLGHAIGDLVLIEVARRLLETLRPSDTASRPGGDEFILILPQTDAEGAARAATRLLRAIAEPFRIGQHLLRSTPSIGIAMYPDDGTDMETLSRRADAAMYQVKRDSRNGFRFFTPEMQARSARALLLGTALHDALPHGQLSLRYQPQLSLPDGRVVGAEALLRWHHPQLGEVSPGEFIPIAEGNGMILPIGEWVLRSAVAQARAWAAQGLPPITIAVNLSALQLRQAALPELVARVVDEAGLPPERLELELTEAAAMNNPPSAIAVMNELAARGIRIAIDDFGTGHSALSYLKRFRVNQLKIDQSFIRDITHDSDDQQIVIAIITLARGLGIATIAEGVETAEQLDVLLRHGCDAAQGYHFSRPLVATDFEAYLRNASGGRGST